MDEQERLVALELKLEDQLRADLGALPVRAYAYYREAAIARSRGSFLGRALAFAVGAVAITLLVVALVAVLRARTGEVPATTPTPIPPAVTTPPASPTASPTANPTPIGFVLPQGCTYVGSPTVSPDFSQWHFDCGPSANRDARGALDAAFTQQGWTSCGPATARAAWAKGATALSVAESSGSPGDHPTISQSSRAAGGCP